MNRRAAHAMSPRKKPSQGRAQATVDALLQATAHILVSDGYEKLSTNRVAAVAGVSIGSLYQYFPSKEALVAALGERHHDEMMSVLAGAFAALDDAADDDAIGAVVSAVVDAMFDAHALHPQLHRALSEEIPRAVIHQHLEQSAMVLVRQLLDEHHDRVGVGDVDAATFLLVSSVEAAAHNAVLHRPDLVEPPALRRELSAMITRYLLPGAPAAARAPIHTLPSSTSVANATRRSTS